MKQVGTESEAAAFGPGSMLFAPASTSFLDSIAFRTASSQVADKAPGYGGSLEMLKYIKWSTRPHSFHCLLDYVKGMAHWKKSAIAKQTVQVLPGGSESSALERGTRNPRSWNNF